jgi:tRNA-dihydrouridine synthase A
VKSESYTFCVAPMMNWTDRHCRKIMRRLSRHARLYSEMITADAILHGNRESLLAHDSDDGPTALQLGGCDPHKLAEAAQIGVDFGYDEINLNVGCPSDRVQSGRFGACLMAEPELVGRCVTVMKQAVDTPVTVKCRIGIDQQNPEKALFDFARHQIDAGVDALIVHARKAWLDGLSPKDNRDVPPLDYNIVHRLKQRYPRTPIIINGGFVTLALASQQLQAVNGVMIGRAAYKRPHILAEVDRMFFGVGQPAPDLCDVVRGLIPYFAVNCEHGVPLKSMTRHLLGMFHGMPGARSWRRHLAENAHLPDAGPQIVIDALSAVEDARERSEASQVA